MEVQLSKETIDGIISDLTKGTNKDCVRVGFLTGREEQGLVVVDGVYVPSQMSTPVESEIPEWSKYTAFQVISMMNKTVVGVVQYNIHFKSFESDVTTQNAESLQRTLDHPLALVVFNSQKEVYSRVIE